MPTASGGVAVVATQVARTDRRALSEAWYDALHLAHGPVAARGVALRKAPAPVTHTAIERANRLPERGPVARFVPANGVQHATARASVARGVPERRRTACETTRRIERAVTTLATRWNGDAAQTIDVAGGRVRLLVRTDRARTRIIAVCSTPLREPVERALAHARFMLATGAVPAGFN